MKKIFKYELHPLKKTICTHALVKFISVQVQRGIPCIWAEVNDSNETVEVEFQTIPTGGKVPDMSFNYLGTFQLDGGNLVFHVYIKELK